MLRSETTQQRSATVQISGLRNGHAHGVLQCPEESVCDAGSQGILPCCATELHLGSLGAYHHRSPFGLDGPIHLQI